MTDLRTRIAAFTAALALGALGGYALANSRGSDRPTTTLAGTHVIRRTIHAKPPPRVRRAVAHGHTHVSTGTSGAHSSAASSPVATGSSGASSGSSGSSGHSPVHSGSSGSGHHVSGGGGHAPVNSGSSGSAGSGGSGGSGGPVGTGTSGGGSGGSGGGDGEHEGGGHDD